MQLASSPAFYEQPLAAMPQLSEKPRQGFATKKTTWKPASNVCNSTVAIGLRAGLVLEGVRKTYRARYYNPATGRFLSEDPLGFAGSGPNLYAYAGDNPISFEDPSGLSSLVYNGSTATITLYSGNNFDGTILAQAVAYNFVASGWGTFPFGTYQADSWHQYNAGDPNSSYGPYGNVVFDVPGRTGMSVHSGRANENGPSHVTHGCIRTTDNFMKTMYDTQFHDFNPVKQLLNVNPFNPPPGINPTPLFWPAGAGNPPAPSNPWNF